MKKTNGNVPVKIKLSRRSISAATVRTEENPGTVLTSPMALRSIFNWSTSRPNWGGGRRGLVLYYHGFVTKKSKNPSGKRRGIETWVGEGGQGSGTETPNYRDARRKGCQSIGLILNPYFNYRGQNIGMALQSSPYSHFENYGLPPQLSLLTSKR